MAGKRKKRRWSDEEKRSICFQTTAAGVSVAQVARRYAMNANLIFKWLRDERYAPEPDAAVEESEPVFLPVEIEAANSPAPALANVPAGRIEIELPGGCRISAENGFDAEALARYHQFTFWCRFPERPGHFIPARNDMPRSGQTRYERPDT